MIINIPNIRTASEAKRWNFWMRQDFYNPSTFPKWIVDLLIKTHLKHFEGFHLFYFMTVNGFDKEIMGNILNMLYTYDKSKITNLLKSSKKKKFYNRKYFDMVEREIVEPDLTEE